MSLKKKIEEGLFQAIDPLMPDYEYFYVISEEELSEVRSIFAEMMEKERDSFDVELGDQGIEWTPNDLEGAERHMRAKAAYDAITVLMANSHRVFKPEDFHKKEGEQYKEDIYDNNMWNGELSGENQH